MQVWIIDSEIAGLVNLYLCKESNLTSHRLAVSQKQWAGWVECDRRRKLKPSFRSPPSHTDSSFVFSPSVPLFSAEAKLFWAMILSTLSNFPVL